MNYQNLTDKQQKEYRLFCDKYLGNTFTFSEYGEPLYFDEQMRMFSFESIYRNIRIFKLEKLNNIK